MSTALGGFAFFSFIKRGKVQKPYVEYKQNAFEDLIKHSQKSIVQEVENNKYSRVNVIKKDGIYLAVGRSFSGLTTSQIPILSSKSQLVKLLVQDTHQKFHKLNILPEIITSGT